MSKVDDLEQLVRGLSPRELSKFREWFVEFDAEVWDQQFQADATAGRLDSVAERAIQAYAAGESTEL